MERRAPHLPQPTEAGFKAYRDTIGIKQLMKECLERQRNAKAEAHMAHDAAPEQVHHEDPMHLGALALSAVEYTVMA